MKGKNTMRKLHIENTPIGYIVTDNNYDGAPDAKGNITGHGQTEREAVENYFDMLEEETEEYNEKSDVEKFTDKIDSIMDQDR
jgi:hypothetical protein